MNSYSLTFLRGFDACIVAVVALLTAPVVAQDSARAEPTTLEDSLTEPDDPGGESASAAPAAQASFTASQASVKTAKKEWRLFGSGSLSSFRINGNYSSYTATNCNNLQCFITDTLWIFGKVKLRYRLLRDGVVVASKAVVRKGIGPIAHTISLTAPAGPGVYRIRRNGFLSYTDSNSIQVSYPGSIDCGPSECFEAVNFGDDIWFAGSDAIHAPVVGDFDCDGKIDDIAYYGACGSGTGCWRVHLGDGTSFGPALNFGGGMWFAGSSPPHRPVSGDFDNDTFHDDIAYYGSCGSGVDCWRVQLGDGSSFGEVRNFGANMWFAGSDPIHAPVSGDFDNDMFHDDIAYYGAWGGGDEVWRVHIGEDGLGFSTSNFGSGIWFEDSTAEHMPVAGDFDSDGKIDDIAYHGSCGSGSACWRVHLSDGATFTVANFGSSIWHAGEKPKHAPIVGDFDGDSKFDDIAYYGKWGSGDGIKCWRVHLGDMNHFSTGMNYCDDAWFKTPDWRSLPVAGMFTNDGTSDIAYFGACGSGDACWRAHVLN